MRFSLAVAAAAALAPVLYVSAQTNHLILVGQGGLTYTPPNITAAEGDTVSFQFTSKNHSVTQSSFAAPCTRLPGGVDSLFQLVPAGATQLPEWTITVNNISAPLWFFCAQTIPADHCAAGMVFSINATPAKTFDAFQAAAKLTGGNTTASAASSGAATGASTAGATGAAGNTAGAVGATGAATTTTGAAGATGAAGNTAGAGAAGAATTTTSGGSSSDTSAPAPTNGALRTGGSAAGVLTFIGVVAGLIL